jgi:hypothetical protein
MRLISSFILISCLFTSVSLADPGDGRKLNDHQFIESESLESPFITTSLASLTGAGFATAKDLKIDLGLFAQGFRYNIAFLDWLSIRAGINGKILSGANAQSALLFGLQLSYDYSIGAKIRALRIGGFQLSASLDVSFDNSVQMSPRDAIVESINKGDISTKTLLNIRSATVTTPGIQLAYAFGSTVGLWFALKQLIAQADGESESYSSTEAGVGVSLNFNQSLGLPVGSSLTYRSISDDSEDTEEYTGIGLFYTGRPELLTGVEVELGKITASRITIDTYNALFKLRYYW